MQKVQDDYTDIFEISSEKRASERPEDVDADELLGPRTEVAVVDPQSVESEMMEQKLDLSRTIALPAPRIDSSHSYKKEINNEPEVVVTKPWWHWCICQ